MILRCLQPLIRPQQQRGLTLVELMIAMALSGLITIAGMASLTLARQGFNSVDVAAQLRDNERFATSILRRVITQAGYQNAKYAVDTGSGFQTKSLASIQPNIKGFNNSQYSENLATGVDITSKTPSVNNSDLLIVRYQAGAQNDSTGHAADLSTAAADTDSSMISCIGSSSPLPTDPDERMISVFYVAVGVSGESSLMCARSDENSNMIDGQPLIHGVENFQVLYGVDGVTPGQAFTDTDKLTPYKNDSVPERYLRADEMIVSGNDAGTLANWRRVRSLRIGMVIRGPVGSAAPGDASALYLLGTKNLMDSTADIGSKFSAQTDRRLRQIVTFTVHLRNPQSNI